MIRRGYALAPVVVAAGLATIVTACSSAQPVSTAPTRSRVSTPTTVQTTPDPTRDRPARRTRPAQHAPSTALPLGYRTAHARQVITVVAPSATSTQASLQAWRAVSGGWRRVGPAVPAWLGAAGFSEHASESVSATPTGSFTLTRAFGHDPDPGTSLPYRRTTPDDWWIS
ncbi:MAG: hypothetical protein INR72_16055, partial [Williamsia herbipolensis]|nr:hypothetical protein [Williamsia herbipolensis]